jgi:hypothetical protein
MQQVRNDEDNFALVYHIVTGTSSNYFEQSLEPRTIVSPPQWPFRCVPYASLFSDSPHSPDDNLQTVWNHGHTQDSTSPDHRIEKWKKLKVDAIEEEKEDIVLSEIFEHNVGRWTLEERTNFDKGLAKFGPQWSEIARQFVVSRSSMQVTNYGIRHMKHKKKIQQEETKI